MKVRALLPVLLLALSCNGTTGYDLVQFYAAASGPKDAVAGKPYAFDAGGHHVVLTKATLHVGAMYLIQSRPSSGAGAEPCTLPETYVGEVRGGTNIDLLDPSLQEFPVIGDGSTLPALSGQVWLTHGDVNADQDSADGAPILALEGTVDVGAPATPFSASVHIDTGNRIVSQPSSASPGASPICQLRIVTPIPTDITLAQGGTLVLRVDPKALFNNADLTQLPKCGAGLCFSDSASDGDQPSINLFQNLTGAGAVYRFDWLSTAP